MYSFDVFDTLITRTTADPRGIFALIKDRLEEEKAIHHIDDYVIQNFFELRIHSEELARKACCMQNVEEVSLSDIYKAMAVCGCLEEFQIQYLCALEEAIEIANVTGISENIHRLKELIAQGERVILVSDMYLPKETIRRMLLQTDDVFKDIPLYVSSEYKKRKMTGNLYRTVKEIEQIDYSDWTHIGDNLHQDIEVPYHLGIRVELVPRIELSDLERELLGSYGQDSRLQLMIGSALRSEREFEELLEPTKNILNPKGAYRTGCRYAGPVLYCYAEWIVEQAVKKNIRRLYFIARDGYLVKKIVDIILAKKDVKIETFYIYGSRKAWRMASLSKEHYNLYQMIIWSHTNKIYTLMDLAEVLHVSLEDMYGFLPGTFKKSKSNLPITNVELEYIVDKLSKSEEFQDWHLDVLKKEKELAERYLEQEVDLSDENFAFVDVAGGGLTQGCLRELIRGRYEKPIRTFFFKIDRVNLIEGSITDTFVPSYLSNNLTIEMMCRAPHGQTRCYQMTDGRIVPELEEEESKALIRHGFYDYEAGIIRFSEIMCEVSERWGGRIGSLQNLLLYVKHIAESPSSEVLEYFATVPSSDSGRENEIREYAPKLTKEDIKRIFWRHPTDPLELYYKGSDLNYSILRASEEEKNLIEQCQREYNSAAAKLFRQEKERAYKELRDFFGRAATYPVNLLEERVVLYGAGRFGQDLYHRLMEEKEHEIVLWADKKAEDYQKQGFVNIHCISDIKNVEYDQIVIAVMAKELADEIRTELVGYGFNEEQILWFWPYNPQDPRAVWRTERIG